ncbi:MAG: CYTH domain-containing protein [Firmicutes bacterium]|nr:CYTH domain-containing protein [Bacillota bacterium]
MEIELKYSIPDDLTADKMWEDAQLLSWEEEDTREKVPMKAAYFDTEDRVLSQHDIAFRVRKEGTRIVASLKWGGSATGALYQRQEINVPVDDEACFMMPSAQIFKESDIGKQVIDLVGDKILSCIVEMSFMRRRFRIDKDDTIIEVSIDSGEIITDNGTEPISEIELELFSGEQDVLMDIGAELAAKYSLSEGLSSKYKRGLNLLG